MLNCKHTTRIIDFWMPEKNSRYFTRLDNAYAKLLYFIYES